MPRIKKMRGDGLETFVLFCFQLNLMKNDAFQAALLGCHQRHSLCLVGLDKAHMYVMHERRFVNVFASSRMCFSYFYPDQMQTTHHFSLT